MQKRRKFWTNARWRTVEEKPTEAEVRFGNEASEKKQEI